MPNDDQVLSPSLGPEALHAIVHNTMVGIFATALDRSVLFANQPLITLLGFSDAAEFFSHPRSTLDFYVDPAEADAFRRSIMRDGNASGIISRLRRRDGKEIWVSECGSAVTNPDGSVAYFVGSLVDVTELVEAKNQLAEAESSYRRIFERAQEGIYRSSLDGRQLRSNPALNHLNGYATEQEHLDAVKDIATEWYVDPNRRAEFKYLMQEYGEVQDFESEIFAHKTRRRIWISENAYLVRSDDGTPLYYEGTVRDITDRKRAEEQLRQAREEAERANKVKSQFLGTMSHELRTPLNAILGFSDFLRTMPAAAIDEPRMRSYAEDIHGSASHLLELVDDILDISRLEGGHFEIDAGPVDAAAAVRRAIRLVIAAHAAAAVDVVLEGFGAACTILGDAKAVHQCLVNVISNAVKFSEPQSSVTVSADRCSGPDSRPRFRIMVQDQGPGIPADVVKRLGQPFNKSRDPSVASAPGTGLGLAITHALMDRMGGELSFEPAHPSGTIGILTFQVNSHPAQQRADSDG